MLKLTLRNLVATRGRLVLTVLAVFLGTAFISTAGTAGATLNESFSAGDESDFPDVTVAATPESVFAESPPLEQSTVDAVAAVDGVAAVTPSVFAPVQLSTTDGEPLAGESGGVVTIVVSASVWSEGAGDLPELIDGQAPAGAGDVVLHDSFAADAGLGVGDPVVIASPAVAQEARIVGLVATGEDDFAEVPYVIYEDALALAGRTGPDDVAVTAAPGVSNDDVKDRITAVLGDGFDVETAAESFRAATDAGSSTTRVVQSVLGGFGAIALIVGSFLIGNTVNMIVTQRQRELALLRAIGATRRQVRRAVITEAFIVTSVSSVAGAAAGIAGGYGLVRLLASTDDAFGAISLALSPLFLAIAVVSGPLVGVAAARAAAGRATTISPVAAMSEVGVADVGARPSPVRLTLGLVALAAALAVMAVGITGEGRTAALWAAAGGVVALVALIVLNPVLAAAVAPAVHRFMPGSGAAALMARRNTARNPQRVAGTASAMLIGLTVVVIALVLASSVSASFGGASEAALEDTDVIVSEVTGVSETSLAAVAGVPEVATAAGIRQAAVGYEDELLTISGVTAGIDELLDVGSTTGKTPGALAPGEVAVADGAADRFDLTIGDRIDVEFPDGGTGEWTVAGTYASEILLFGLTVPDAALADTGTAPGWAFVLARTGDGVTPDAGVRAIDEVLVAGQGTPQTIPGWVEANEGQLAILLNIILGLLAVTLVVALLGVVNTTVLSTLERTREFGMLRAIGTTRGQLRTAVRRETVAITLYGTLTGVLAGLAIGIALVQALRSVDVDQLSVPWLQLVLVLVISLVAGVLAAALPARRASRMNVLEALRTS